MIRFLKLLISGLISKNENEEINENENENNNDKKNITLLKRIIYFSILLCTVIFIIFLIYFTIQQLPNFIESLKESYNDSSYIIQNLKP